MSKLGRPRATLDDGTVVQGRTVVLATGTPVLDRGLYFAKVEPKRSYALAFEYSAPPELMLLGVGSPSRSVRDTPGRGAGTDRLLLVGGEGHAVGRTRSELARVDALRAWTESTTPAPWRHMPGRPRTTPATTVFRSSARCLGEVARSTWPPASTSGA